MSELMNAKNDGSNFRRELLTNVSLLAVLGYLGGVSVALAYSDDQTLPTVWIELGGQVERVSSSQGLFSPPFFNDTPANVLSPMVDAQLHPKFSIGGEGKLTFAPHGSDWTFSASVRYGRSNASRHLHYETKHATVPETIFGHVIPGSGAFDEFGDGQSGLTESHLIVDFRAGKDVGLGSFGRGSVSTLSAGVRFAQFASGSDVSLHARPLYHSSPSFGVPGFYNIHALYFQNNSAEEQEKQSTEAIGPAVSWDASIPISGDNSGMSFALDWGVNAAVLFGRQRAHVHHKTQGYYLKNSFFSKNATSYTNPSVDRSRSRSVAIPNVGAFVGASLRFPSAKVSLGYRGDFFFNAVDNGIDARNESDQKFYGPFATISVGLGG